MSNFRHDIVYYAYDKAHALVDYNIYDDIDKRHEFRKQIIDTDDSLTDVEKLKVIEFLNYDYYYHKILLKIGKKRICENCQEECLATSYCEYCIRNYLAAKFKKWTSGNNDIDDLIRKCQIESLGPSKIIEWIPFYNLLNVKLLTKGGCSEIYTAEWFDGQYCEWNSTERLLKRNRSNRSNIVILKKLNNIENANRSWFEEAKFHLTIANRWPDIVQCYGLTQDPFDKTYMLVMRKLDTDLRKYLQQNHNQLTWKERIKITVDIINALSRIHGENAIHRDLHSGNILYYEYTNSWFIGDFGFCGPVDKPLGSIYGNLPYIAPEVIREKGYTFASDIYSIAMIMWEISSGQPPFTNCKHSYNLALDIINGRRPKIVPGTPSKYEELMIQSWDADPTKRPDTKTLLDKIEDINRLYYQSTQDNNETEKFLIFPSFYYLYLIIRYLAGSMSSNIYRSEIYQEACHSKLYSFNIPEDNNEEDIYNNANLHSEDQDELEIPDDLNYEN
ncbi:hypothetical protein RclHR1_04540017 [Rhizophagus clarus]|uniref:Kinase-like domain-containing protein n=1 Tax=Rhizophagus clarus TaxID=94130 RepID=A0A2Z6RMZ5_9GLOM|nr:hypothetical protein RclHR1_04540017 [Rhizophagus clarus]GES90132.1 kinase-like domain-containing protein [Rhizophagus clarus]